MSLLEQYKITGKVVIITGGAGLIGRKDTEAVLEGEGIPVLLDIFEDSLARAKQEMAEKYPGKPVETYVAENHLRKSEMICLQNTVISTV